MLGCQAGHRIEDLGPDLYLDLWLSEQVSRGMTWQEIAFGLGLGTAQAARQRCERLADRTDTGVEGPE